MKNFKDFLQGSSIAKVPYKIMNMDNLAQDAIADVAEDDGPHTSNIEDPINFKTVDYPEKYVNQPNSRGNQEPNLPVAKRNTGKPMKTIQKKAKKYGVEDLSGAVAGIATEDSRMLSFKDFITEVLTKDTPTGEVIKDFVHSKNKRFKGKSKKERIRMALGAKYAMMKEAKKMGNPCWKGYKALGTKMKGGKEVPNCIPVSEGSARGGYTRKGIYAKKRALHLDDAGNSEKRRGVVQSPKTDARSYSWTHLQGYNKGPEDLSPEKKKAAKLKNPKKKVRVPTPVTGNPGHRLAALMNHPLYKQKYGNAD